jgi:tellurite resistance protein TehA-like permease
MAEPNEHPPAAAGPAWLRSFFPGYFALVMATGIVSLAWHLQGFNSLARGLFCFNVPAFGVLWAITVRRWIRFRPEMVKDLANHARGATFLTTVAASSVLGKQFLLLTALPLAGKCLWLLALLLWLVLIYTFFTAITLVEPKPKLEAGISGSWLLAVVATESLCTLGTMVATSFSRPGLVLFVSLSACFVGAMLYMVLITLILYRWFFRSMDPSMLTPPYWINMGALAITTLAGARLLSVTDSAPILKPFAPFVIGFTLFFWAAATWWIPLLLIVGIWRHLYQKLPLKYDPQYWSLVFPLGMYSVATSVFAGVAPLPFLRPISVFFAIAGLAAWSLAFLGLLGEIACALRRNVQAGS